MHVMQQRSRSRTTAGKRPPPASAILRGLNGGAYGGEPPAGAPERVTFIPAPRVLVRHLASGTEMGVYPMTAHQLADQIAARWRGSVELLPVESVLLPNRGAGREGTPR
jgi:hypothetical protein